MWKFAQVVQRLQCGDELYLSSHQYGNLPWFRGFGWGFEWSDCLEHLPKWQRRFSTPFDLPNSRSKFWWMLLTPCRNPYFPNLEMPTVDDVFFATSYHIAKDIWSDDETCGFEVPKTMATSKVKLFILSSDGVGVSRAHRSGPCVYDNCLNLYETPREPWGIRVQSKNRKILSNEI